MRERQKEKESEGEDIQENVVSSSEDSVPPEAAEVVKRKIVQKLKKKPLKRKKLDAPVSTVSSLSVTQSQHSKLSSTIDRLDDSHTKKTKGATLTLIKKRASDDFIINKRRNRAQSHESKIPTLQADNLAFDADSESEEPPRPRPTKLKRKTVDETEHAQVDPEPEMKIKPIKLREDSVKETTSKYGLFVVLNKEQNLSSQRAEEIVGVLEGVEAYNLIYEAQRPNSEKRLKQVYLLFSNGSDLLDAKRKLEGTEHPEGSKTFLQTILEDDFFKQIKDRGLMKRLRLLRQVTESEREDEINNLNLTSIRIGDQPEEISASVQSPNSNREDLELAHNFNSSIQLSSSFPPQKRQQVTDIPSSEIIENMANQARIHQTPGHAAFQGGDHILAVNPYGTQLGQYQHPSFPFPPAAGSHMTINPFGLTNNHNGASMFPFQNQASAGLNFAPNFLQHGPAQPLFPQFHLQQPQQGNHFGGRLYANFAGGNKQVGPNFGFINAQSQQLIDIKPTPSEAEDTNHGSRLYISFARPLVAPGSELFLRKAFENAAPNFQYLSRIGPSNTYAFVKYETAQSAELARQKMSGFEIEGMQLKIVIAQPPKGLPATRKRKQASGNVVM